MGRLCLIVALIILLSATLMPARADEAVGSEREIGIIENLGGYVPLDIGFLDAEGDSVYLRDIVTRPTILTLVYYHCPTICKPLLGGVAEVVDRSELQPGEDYNLLTVSFNDEDGPDSAYPVKVNFTNPIEKITDPDAWRFLTGDSVAIASLTQAVGFQFERRESDFVHGTALIALSPDGKIVRYLYGMRYQPFDLKMAVTEASKGTIAPSIARVLTYCFSYDPEGRKYVFNATRLAGAGVLMFSVGWVVFIKRVGRKDKAKTRT